MKRVIFIEPNINNKIINKIFNKYNSDSKFVNPHICLVFPFESNLTTNEIDTILKNTLSGVECFDIFIKGISISYENNNNFIFLNIADTNDILATISEKLYYELGNNAILKTDKYIPHITIAKNKSKDKINLIYNEISRFNTLLINLKVDKIYSKIMIKDSMNNIRLQNELEYILNKKKKERWFNEV